MTIEEQKLKEYRDKLTLLYAKANTKSKKKKIVLDLFNFSNICYEYFEIDEIFPWDNDPEMLKFIDDLMLPFAENVLEDRQFFSDVSKKAINTFQSLKYPFYKDYGRVFNRLTEKEEDEIIFGFLNSYDPKLLDLYKKKINDLEIFCASIGHGYAGLTYPFESLNKTVIFLNGDIPYIRNAAILMHEFGHSYEYDIMYRCGVENYSSSIDVLPYTEVSSMFFQYAFYKYLKENKIYSDDTDTLLHHYYKLMFAHIYSMNIICNMDFVNINSYGYVPIENENLAKYANWIKEKLNYYDIPSNVGEEFNFKDSFIYGLGGLFSIYLYDNYKDDPNNFRKEFRNALINYQYNGIDAFKNVGVTPDVLLKGDTLKRVLKDSR